MMHRIIKNVHGYLLKNQKICLSIGCLCMACSQGMLIVRPAPLKVVGESPTFLQRIQGIYVDLFIHHVGHFFLFFGFY